MFADLSIQDELDILGLIKNKKNFNMVKLTRFRMREKLMKALLSIVPEGGDNAQSAADRAMMDLMADETESELTDEHLDLSPEDQAFFGSILELNVGGKYSFRYDKQNSLDARKRHLKEDFFDIEGVVRKSNLRDDRSYLVIHPLDGKGYIRDGRLHLGFDIFYIRHKEDRGKVFLVHF